MIAIKHIMVDLAYNILWNNLNKGGFFISDDISDNKAFIDFVDKFNLNPSIILFKNKYIGLIIKNKINKKKFFYYS